MVQRMSGPERISATALSKEVGVSQTTLSRWLQQASTLRRMGNAQRDGDGGAKSPRQWSAEEKLRVVNESSKLGEDELGAFLRHEGLHMAQLEEWRKIASEAAISALSGAKKRSKASPESKHIKELNREIRRKDRALAEVTALLALKKKVQEIWGDEDDDTST
jgi:transposase-like protein